VNRILQIVQAAAPNTVCGVPAAQRCRQDAGGPSKPIIDTGLCGNERCENVAGLLRFDTAGLSPAAKLNYDTVLSRLRLGSFGCGNLLPF